MYIYTSKAMQQLTSKLVCPHTLSLRNYVRYQKFKEPQIIKKC